MSIQLFKTGKIHNSIYRYYFANNYAFIIGGFAHICFIPVFLYLNLITLALYNIFSVFVFIFSFILNRKGYHELSTIPVSVEIMLHATLATYFIGWDSGFFYYTLAIIPLLISSPSISHLTKFILSILLSFFYISLRFFSDIHPPVVILDKNVLVNLYLMNSFFIVNGIAYLVYYFSRASEITEHKINQARDEADTANQAKSMFLANMSHELRTPLNAIIGYSEMLRDDALDEGNEQQSEDLTKISSAGNHLLSLINSILDLTKIEAGKIEMEFQRVNVNTLINEIVTTINPLVNKNQNILIVDNSNDIGECCIEQTKVKQILLNLLSNACKFTKDGTITFSVSAEIENNEPWLSFAISDTGIGIAEEKLEQLFMPFVQADISTTRLYGGTGLGLTISKHFVNMMNGMIEVKSRVDMGTTFIVKLPVNEKLCTAV